MDLGGVLCPVQGPKIKSVKRTKKVAAAPYVAKQAPKKETNPLIEKRTKNFGIGTGIDTQHAMVGLDS